MGSVISAHTIASVDGYIDNPSSVLLIIASPGSGKRVVVERIVDSLISTKNSAKNEQYIRVVDPDKKSISIDEIRTIKSWVKLKHTSKSVHRVVVIYDSERLTHEAQNALLKLLEDTPKQTLFIMTASSKDALLDTVVSRSTLLGVSQPTVDEMLLHYSGYSVSDVERAYKMCAGRARLIDEVLNDPEGDFVSMINDAKSLIAGSSFERLCKVDVVAKTYPIDMYLFGLKTIYKSLLPRANDKVELKKRTEVIRQIIKSEELVSTANPNPKLLLTNLCMNL